MVSRVRRRSLAVAAGLLADRILGEPPAEVHPVALFGRAMTALESRVWSDDIAPGALYAGVGVIGGGVLGRILPGTSVATATVVAGRELRRVASEVVGHLETGDLNSAKRVLPSLVGRDPSQLDTASVAAAVIESLAENTVDAVVAPALWALVAGAPGAFAYRAVNTMDAMVGHRSARYNRFGRVSARLDDVANWVPARLTAALFVLAVPGRRSAIASAVRRDASTHPSPNAGVSEAAMAGALGVRLGGTLQYGDRIEHRPTLGDGARPTPADARRAINVASRAELAFGAGLMAVALLVRRR